MSGASSRSTSSLRPDPLLQQRPPFAHRVHSPLGTSSSLMRSASKPLAPRTMGPSGVAFGSRKNDPLLRASRSTSALPQPAVSAVSQRSGLSSATAAPGTGLDASRPTTPGGSVRALRGRLETARLTDQNITLSENVHRLSSQVEAHMRFHTRAEQASTSLEQKHANAEQEIARLKAENNALAEKLRTARTASTTKEKRLETMLAVAKQEMASLRQRVNVQEAQLRRLELASRDGASEDGVDSSDAPGSTSDMPPRPLASSGSSRRLSIAVSLRSPGSGPLLISPMQSPAVTPRSNTPRSDTSSPRRDSRVSETDATAAAKVYELQSEVAKLKAKLGAAQRQSQSLRGDVRAATERADAYMQELTAKDAQMGTLRQRISELEVQASTEGGDVGGDDFEAALREEMDSMRASYTAKLRKANEELESTQRKNSRREEYWKDQMNDAKQRYLGLQMQYERLQRKLKA